MSSSIDISSDQRQMLSALLRQYIPAVRVWAYGSRVKWTARQNSDLDLVAFAGPDQRQSISELRLALSESDLPFLVDLHVWDEVPEKFHEIIQREYVVLQESSALRGQSDSLGGGVGDWDLLPLLDCTSDKQISYGIVQPGSNVLGGIPIVRVNNLTGGNIDIRDAMRVSPEIEKPYQRTRLKGGELLLSLVGSTGNVAFVPSELKDWNVARAIAVIRPRIDIGPNWLKLCLESASARDYLDARANTTVQKTLNLTDVKKLPIPLPPLHWRQEILSVVNPLDDAGSVLQSQNESLETIARTIFKSWFVDFDPVRAKIEGREPDGMDPATAALFPEVLGDNFIPRGWSAVPLDSIATFLNGVALQKYPAGSDQDSIPAIKIAQLRRGSTEGADRISRNLPAQYLVNDGDLIFSWSGSLEVEIWWGGVGALNQHLFKVGSDCCPQWFVYGWLREHLEHFRQIAESKVTTMGHIQRHHLHEALVVVPPKHVLESLGEMLMPIHERIIQSRLQMRTLDVLRDILLPRLISGKLRVPEAAKLMEAVI